ncbi:hypothetical protein DNTS_029007 [Danionella cerebrum]|uniref:FAD-binding FR-type domain-containing protein n=1 Tax=Danionella cerebrum TaxID=2873325 RepID=A0A553PUJ0_9TELE|nr:hypothetical protein DNTS_029007 [Danionella translucida]
MVSFSVRFSDDFPALNVAQYRGQDPRMLIVSTVPGITGVLLVLLLFVMCTASTYCVRVSNYEIFWYSHHLFMVFYVTLIVHVSGGTLKYQSNVKAHPPGCIPSNLSSGSWTGHRDARERGGGSQKVCREEALFQPHFPQTWLWISAPLCWYCAERFYRFIRSSADPVIIVSIISHPCDVIELHMLRRGFKPRPGQYILVNCPRVSSFENHPFTLTSCPTEKSETFGIHFRALGDWTSRFSQLLLQPSDSSMISMKQPQMVYVDGPFSGASEEVLNYEVSLCVAGGIGITPFACVLHALLDDWRQYKLRRLYLVWVCRELQAFYWFADLLCSLSERSIGEERYRFLSSRLQIGRPNWKVLFQEIGRANHLKKVGVFCCGPKGISRVLHALCNSSPRSQTVFEYNKESFI